MTSLEQIIRDDIVKNGPMPFARFMQLALFDQAHGYYNTHDPLQDFATAPEISQLFGEMIALWCVDVWMKIGSPSNFTLLECGPGRGTLMADVLRTIKVSAEFTAAAKPTLLETSPLLRQKQREKLSDYHVTWIDGLQDLNATPVIMFCNELFDVFPLQRFMKTKQGWAEQAVYIKNNALDYTLLPIAANIQSDFSDPVFANALVDAIMERSPDIHHWVNLFATHLAAHGGAGLMIDYGYEGPMIMDSVQSIHNKNMSLVLERPGHGDISANVDFGPFRTLAKTHGLQSFPLATQRNFLMNCGILQRMIMLKRFANREQQKHIDEALHRLIAHERMGDMFKVFCMTQANIPTPIGFES
ncbi:MAG: hypothetical protein EB059_05950 [Alphaproteobacteria bacterium]|nr:hypothetical protein [Alphaproteobacteria bacterium]